ncbi:MAG: lipid-binding SYLF domain-containing protein [Methylococcus sp.]|nr:lipid-binding SYLF domain-containing protein [Methylococcus sp.]
MINRLVVLAALLLAAPVRADDRDIANDLLRDATITFNEFVSDPNMGWFRDNVKDARALVIAPQVLKLGFVFGGSGGNAIVLAKDKQTGEWGYPAFYTAGAVTAGLQIGGELTDIIMMVMTEGGMNALLSSKFQLGADASIAAGPVGTGSQVATVDILQFSRAKGIYGGLTLEGAVIAPRDGLNSAFYGRIVDPVDILIRHTVTNPLADRLRKAVAKATSHPVK